MVLDTSAVRRFCNRSPRLTLSPGRSRRRRGASSRPCRCWRPASWPRADAARRARDLDGFLWRIGAEVVPFDAKQADAARRAFRAYGKGRHPAGLNFGDCAAYALAKTAGEPLLFKGNDFARTDITSALRA